MDHCLTYNTLEGDERSGDGCGEAAATLFCQHQGYKLSTKTSAMYYAKQATFVMGMGEANPESDGMGLGQHTFFSSISCKDKLSDHDGLVVEARKNLAMMATSTTKFVVTASKIIEE